MTYADGNKELGHVDVSVSVGVQELHQFLNHGLAPNLNSYSGLGFCNVDLDLSQSTEELLGVDLLVSVEGVEVPEDSAQATDGLGSSSLDLGSHLLENLTFTKREGSAKSRGVTRLDWRVSRE